MLPVREFRSLVRVEKVYISGYLEVDTHEMPEDDIQSVSQSVGQAWHMNQKHMVERLKQGCKCTQKKTNGYNPPL